MLKPLEPLVYQLKVVLQGISPMIWRRILVKSDSTIADLHYTLQISNWRQVTQIVAALVPQLLR